MDGVLEQILTGVLTSGPVAAVLMGVLYLILRDRNRLLTKLDAYEEKYEAMLVKTTKLAYRVVQALKEEQDDQ